MVDDPTTEQAEQDPVERILERLLQLVRDEYGHGQASRVEGEPVLGLEYGGQEFFVEVTRA